MKTVTIKNGNIVVSETVPLTDDQLAIIKAAFHAGYLACGDNIDWYGERIDSDVNNEFNNWLAGS